MIGQRIAARVGGQHRPDLERVARVVDPDVLAVVSCRGWHFVVSRGDFWWEAHVTGPTAGPGRAVAVAVHDAATAELRDMHG